FLPSEPGLVNARVEVPEPWTDGHERTDIVDAKHNPASGGCHVPLPCLPLEPQQMHAAPGRVTLCCNFAPCLGAFAFMSCLLLSVPGIAVACALQMSAVCLTPLAYT